MASLAISSTLKFATSAPMGNEMEDRLGVGRVIEGVVVRGGEDVEPRGGSALVLVVQGVMREAGVVVGGGMEELDGARMGDAAEVWRDESFAVDEEEEE